MRDTSETTLTREDRTELEGESLDSLSNEKIDRDLADMINPAFLRPVKPLRQRQPEDVPLVYLGSRVSKRHTPMATVIVPDTENDEKVTDVLSMVTAWDPDRERPTPATLHISGPSYNFVLNETTLVAKDDAPFLLAHEKLLFRRAADVQAERTPALVERNDIEDLRRELAEMRAHLGVKTTTDAGGTAA